MSRVLSRDDRYRLTRRLSPVFFGFLVLLIIILGRVIYLSAFLGSSYKKRSQVNRIQHQVLPSRRGAIYDRNGKVLAADEPTFHLVQKPSLTRETGELISVLSEGLRLSPSFLKKKVKPGKRSNILRGMTDAQRIWFQEHAEKFPNFTVSIQLRRVYQYSTDIAPVVGYTGEISPGELNRRRGEGLYQGSYVGKAGIEKSYDSYLQGRDGIRWVETTAEGNVIRVLDSPTPVKPIAGDTLQLNLDIRLQQFIANSFPSDSEGAAIVMGIPDGEVYALYSHPSFNPNKLLRAREATVESLLTKPGDPLHNRVIQSRFPPGSTFKVFG
ncbi:MAG: penicillin-binding transpeptidase domain-containing protein, partial [bacterium]